MCALAGGLAGLLAGGRENENGLQFVPMAGPPWVGGGRGIAAAYPRMGAGHDAFKPCKYDAAWQQAGATEGFASCTGRPDQSADAARRAPHKHLRLSVCSSCW